MEGSGESGRTLKAQRGTVMQAAEPQLCQLLTDCLKKNRHPVEASMLSNLSREEWQAFLSLTRDQHMTPLLWHRLREKGLDSRIPTEAARVLRDGFLQNTLRNMGLHAELLRLLRALEPHGIPLVLLKGIFLANAVYDNIGLRVMNDIDVLARPTDLGRVIDVLAGMGYTPALRVCSETIVKEQQHMPPMVSKNGNISFEVHWSLTGPREGHHIDPAGLWERALPAEGTGSPALALSAEDLLLHLCMHMSYHHQFTLGMRPLCDIAETISWRASTLDWSVLVEHACLWGWRRGVYLALWLARHLVDADVPAHILEVLRPEGETDEISEAVCDEVFADKASVGLISLPFARLVGQRRLVGKLRILCRQVFLPRAQMACMYRAPENSLRLYFLYVRRLVDVLGRYGPTFRRFRRGDPMLKTVAERKTRIATWLAALP